VRHVVERYKDKIKYWEIWNEPNHEHYWVPQDGLAAYAELLKGAYAVIKAADPSAQVLVGGLTGKYWEDMGKLYNLGAGKSFDIVNIHPFANPLDRNPWNGMRAQYQNLRQIMAANGDSSKPVWITEIGCPGVKPGVKKNEWWLGRNTTEAEQSRWVETVYKEMLQWQGMDKVFWAFFRDTPDHFFSGADNFGLLREDFSKKPSYETYKKLATGRGPGC
jgi:exo-beta-1,3-glucanase (GH17 family)